MGASPYGKDLCRLFYNLIWDVQLYFFFKVLLVTMDVVTLYRPQYEATHRVLDSPDDTDSAVSKSALNIFRPLTLKLNNCTFMSTHYLQIYGAAMASRFSRSYTNIHMTILKERCLK